MKQIRNSKQRDAIYQYLLASKDHPSAEQVYFDIKKEYPHISFGTIYRNLNFLAEQGKIKKLNVSNQSLFDGNMKQHYHFICDECHHIYDIDDTILPISNEMKQLSHRVIDYNMTMHGICEQCLEKEK